MINHIVIDHQGNSILVRISSSDVIKKTFFMLISAEHEICPASKSKLLSITLFFFLLNIAEHENLAANNFEAFIFIRRECLFVLRFYGPVNPVGSCQARSVYLTTRLLGRLSPLSG